MNAKAMIRWTDDEIAAIAHQFVKDRMREPLGPVTTQLLHAIRVSVEAHRFRKLESLANCPPLLKKVGECWRAEVLTPRAPMEQPVPIMLTMQQVVFPTFDEMQAQLSHEDITELFQRSQARENKRLQEQVDRLQSMLEEVHAKVHERPAAHARESVGVRSINPALRRETRRRLVRVAVLGPTQDQFRKIEEAIKEFGIQVELVAIDKETKAHRLPMTTDEAILWTKFLPHTWNDQAKESMGDNRRIHYVSAGGLEAIIQLLRDIASRYPNGVVVTS